MCERVLCTSMAVSYLLRMKSFQVLERDLQRVTGVGNVIDEQDFLVSDISAEWKI